MYNIVQCSNCRLIESFIIFTCMIMVSAGMGVTADEAPTPTVLATDRPPSLVVKTQQDLISVKAINVPLKDVIERIGWELGIAVDAKIGEEDKVTTEFQDLSLEAALKHMSGNYVYITEKEGEKVSKIFLYPRGEEPQMSRDEVSLNKKHTGRSAGSPQPFKLEIDPAGFMEEGQ